jgi:diaminopimelate decarboxylase
MNHFKYQNDELCCEAVPIEKIVGDVGSPVYIYSYSTLKRHFQAYAGAFSEIDHLVCFAVKANSNIAVLNILGSLGAGADIVSGGELFRAQKAGIPAGKIVFAGVGKTESEIETAIREGILFFNVESSEELILINTVAKRLSQKAPVALRVNPDVDPLTHPYISTGLIKNKFGIDIHRAMEVFKTARQMKNIEVVGVHKHIGSQITEVGPFQDALEKIAELVKKLRSEGIDIRYLNLGGGLGITYDQEKPPTPKELAGALSSVMAKLKNVKIVLEPGRSIAGNAGILVTKVLYRKETPVKKFLIVDAGMNDLLRPSLYGAHHAVLPVCRTNSEEGGTFDIVGPICETGDFLARDRKMRRMNRGDLLAVMSAGAYGFTMSSNYNSRPRLAEVLVKDSNFYLIHKRETLKDLIRGEVIPTLRS